MATIPLAQMTVAQATASGQLSAYNALVNNILSDVPGSSVYTGASSGIPAGGVPSAMSSLTSGGASSPGGGTAVTPAPTIASLQQQIMNYATSPAFTQSHPNYWNNLPYDITQVTPTAPVKTSANTGSFGNIANASASMNGLNVGLDALTKQQQDFQTAELARQDTQNKANQSLLSKFSSSLTSPDQARTNAQNQTGINPVQYFAQEKASIAEIGSLTETYNNTVAARDQQIATTQDKYASTNFISNQTAQINRNAAPELARQSANINSKAAVLQALQGNFKEAQTFVNQAVQDAISTNKFNVDMYHEFLQSNNDTFNSLDKIYRDAFQASYDIAKTQYTEQRADKTEVGKLLLANPQAGINISTDSLEEAYAKIGQNPMAQKPETFGSAGGGYYQQVYDPKTNTYKNTKVIGGTSTGGTGGSSIKLTQSKLNNGIANSGYTASEFSALDSESQNIFANGNTALKAKVKTVVDSLSSGSSPEELKSEIDASNAPAGIKTYLKSQVDANAPKGNSEEGWWSKFTSWLGY